MKGRRLRGTEEIKDVDNSIGLQENNGLKNLLEVGPAIQARLAQ